MTKPGVAHDGPHRLVVGEHVAVEASNSEGAGHLDQRPRHRGAQPLALDAVGDEHGDLGPLPRLGAPDAAEREDLQRALVGALLGDERRPLLRIDATGEREALVTWSAVRSS